MSDRALALASEISVGVTNAIVAVEHSQDITFVAQYATAFKLQGSSDNGATYADIAGTSMPGDGSLAQRQVLSVYRSLFDHLKVVMTSLGGETASVAIIKRWLRNEPPMDMNRTFTKHIVDPVLGTP